MGFWDNTWLGKNLSAAGGAVNDARLWTVDKVADGIVWATYDEEAGNFGAFDGAINYVADNVDEHGSAAALGRMVTDGQCYVTGATADAVVAVTWDYTIRYGVNAFRDEENHFGKVGWGTCREGLRDAGQFAWDDPRRAGALALQGGTNALTATVGLVGDVVCQVPDIAHNVVWDWTLRPVSNLGISAGNYMFDYDMEHINQVSIVDWGICAGGLHNVTQFIDPIEEWVYERNEDGSYKLTEEMTYEHNEDGSYKLNAAGEKIVSLDENGDPILRLEKEISRDENGDPIRNPNANAERTILYVTQGVGEVGTFVLVSAATAGIGGAALAAARGSATAVRVGGAATNVSRTARMVDGFKTGFNAGARWTTPITSNSVRATELGNKAKSLTSLGQKLSSGQPLSLTEKARSLRYIGTNTEKGQSAFNRAASAAVKGDEYAIKANARLDLGRRFSGVATSPGRAIPEIAALELATGMGFFGDLSRGRLSISAVEAAEAMKLDVGLQGLIENMKASEVEAGSREFDELIEIYDVLPGTLEYEEAIRLMNEEPETTPTTESSASRLTDAFAHSLQITQPLQTHKEGFSQYTLNGTPTLSMQH